MKLLKISLLCLTFILVNQANAQKKNWVLGLGFNAVDDDGRPMKELLNLTNGWNALPFPATFTCEKYFNNGLSLEFSESINSYQIGKIIDGDTMTRNIFFLSVDMNAKYHFNSLYDKVQWFDPYVIGGLGITLRAKTVVPTANIGFGATFWATKRFGVNLQSIAKFSLASTGSNYLHHTLGIRYKF